MDLPKGEEVTILAQKKKDGERNEEKKHEHKSPSDAYDFWF